MSLARRLLRKLRGAPPELPGLVARLDATEQRLDRIEQRLDRIEGVLAREDERTLSAELRLDKLESLPARVVEVQGQLSPFMGRIQSGVAGFENDLAALRHRLASIEDALRQQR